MLLPPSIYVVAGDAVKGGMRAANKENGGVRGVVSAKNAVGTNPR
jgi:hypothetical protein